MSDPTITPNSLVIYRGRPARVVAVASDKLSLELEGGEAAKVRPKDVSPLHPGPLHSLAELGARRLSPDVQTAWELLAGSPTSIAEIAELTYGDFAPATAWAAWQLVADGLYFRQTGSTLRASTAEEFAHMEAQRTAEAAERAAWEAFIGRAKAGNVTHEDRRYLREVEDLAYGRTERSRVLKALGREESPENAHAALLDWGAWHDSVNPHLLRAGVNLAAPTGPVSADLGALLADPARIDLTYLQAFAVDDEWTDTPDDAICWEDGPGLGRVWVHVADPAAFIFPGSALDLEARSRGVTLHLPEVVVPMLPADTTPLLGLGLNEFSPALSFSISVDAAGEITSVEIAPSIVRATRLTYEMASARLEEEPFAGLQRIALAFEARRRSAGAAAIDLPEVQVRVRDGRIEIKPVASLPGRMVVENCMILAGEAVARYGMEHGIPLPYATQDAPDSPSSAPAQTLSEMFSLRRTMKRSQYRSTPAAHSGLGLAAYAQATSPLRRYLDLVVHQQVRGHATGSPLLTPAEIVERIGEVEPSISAERQAEWQSEKHWALAYLRRQPGWRGRGILVERRNASGIFIIPELALETQIHLNADLPLDAEVTLALRSVDLARLDARFRIEH